MRPSAVAGTAADRSTGLAEAPIGAVPGLVSICVPTRNRAPWLRRSLASICQQTYAPLDILVCDNDSTDDTEALCRALEARDRRVRYLRHAQDIGLYANHNVGIHESRGQYLCFFHDDDVYRPTIIAEYAAFLQRHPEVGLVCSDWELIDEHDGRIGSRRFHGPAVRAGLDYVGRTIRSGRSSLTCSGTMIRRQALDGVRFDEQGPLGFGDFVVWFRVAERWAVGHIARTLWAYRIHEGALSRRTILSVMGDYERALGGYLQAHLDRWPGHEPLVRRWQRTLDRFVFWALVYEVGRHQRRRSGTPRGQTIFDLMGYALTPEELERALAQLRRHGHGWLRRAVGRFVEGRVRAGRTRALESMTMWAPRIWGWLHR